MVIAVRMPLTSVPKNHVMTTVYGAVHIQNTCNFIETYIKAYECCHIRIHTWKGRISQSIWYFVDYNKFFDQTNRPLLLNKLNKVNFNSLIKSMYSNREIL